MPIYTRDNINYGGMLQAALQNKANYLKNRYDRVAQMGKNWGDAVANSGKVAQDAMFKIAGNYYDQDKIAQQQQFQASEAEKRALEVMERQKEQQKFQEAENKLNRQNTYDIALLNKSIANDEKLYQSKMNYDIQKSNLDRITKAIMTEEDPDKLNELYSAAADARAKMEFYGKDLPDNLKAKQLDGFGKVDGQYVSTEGFKRGMGQWSPKIPSTEQTAATPATNVQTTSNKLAALAERLNNASKSVDAVNALNEIQQLNAAMLQDNERSTLHTLIETAKKKIIDLKKAETNEANYKKELAEAGDNAAKIRNVKAKYGKK
jgi:hypothetical protein